MGDGPASRTRSNSSIKISEFNQPLPPYVEESCSQLYTKESEEEVFKTPTPKEKHKYRRSGRTPSGQQLSNSVKDIRNFFQQVNVTPLKENQSTVKEIGGCTPKGD